MNRGFWDTLPKPFFILAPMYDVTDAPFRRIVSMCGAPNVWFTEFVSADGLTSTEGRARLMHHLTINKGEKPIVAQLFGAKPEKFIEAAELLTELGFSGIDINMGCPDKNIIKSGSCAALFKNPKLAQEIISATKQGAGGLPVSVKIRIGDTKVDWEDWISELLVAKPAAISIHLRTRKEMSKVPAHWEIMNDIVQFIGKNTSEDNRPLVIGNGDVLTLAHAKQKVLDTGCDGAMIGRGVFQNPWVFAEDLPSAHSLKEKVKLLALHAELFEQHFTGIKPFELLKRFYKIYINGFEGAAELREQLYTANNSQELKTILNNHKLL